MVFGFLVNAACILLGTVYPAFQSFRAIRSQDSSQILKWSKYWIVFAMYLVFSTLGDFFLLSYLVPFYELLKFAALFYIVNPWTNGSDLVYDKFVAPFLERHNDDFDRIMETLSLYLHSTFVNTLTGFFGRTVGRLCFGSPDFRALHHRRNSHLLVKPGLVEEDYANIPQLRYDSVQQASSSTASAYTNNPDVLVTVAEVGNGSVIDDYVLHKKSEADTAGPSKAPQTGVRRSRRKQKPKEVRSEDGDKRSVSRSRTRGAKKTVRRNTKASV